MFRDTHLFICVVSIFYVIMSIFGRLFACAKTRLSACIFFLLLQKSRSASPHVEGCCCTILAIKRIPLLSCAAFSGCHPWHPLNMSLHVANSLLTNTTAIRGGSECVPPCTRLNFEFASQIRS